MAPINSKDQLISLFIKRDLFSYLMKWNYIKKGNTVIYAQLLDLGEEDLRRWFAKNGYPDIRDSPRGGENDYVWSLKEGVLRSGVHRTKPGVSRVHNNIQRRV